MNRAPLLGILLLYALAVIVQSSMLPLMEGSDEILHTAYVEHLRQHRTLPDRNLNFENCTQQESGQPPLSYFLAALLLDVANRPLVDCDQLRETYDSQLNPWLFTPNIWNRRDNARVFVITESSLPPAYRENVLLMRATSLLFGLLAVSGAYFAGEVVFRSRKAAALVAMVFAFTPGSMHLSSYFNNDISSVAFATLLIWRVLRLLRDGATGRDMLILAVFSALGALSKMSLLLLLPAVGLALLLEARNHDRWLGRLLRHGLIYAAVLLVLLGPWLVYGIVLYQDPIGTETHVNPDFRYNPPRPLHEVIGELNDIYISYVGIFGTSRVLLDVEVYHALGFAALLAIMGYVRGFTRKTLTIDRFAVHAVLVLALALVVFGAGFYRWFTTVFFVTARLLHPIHIVTVLFLVAGWRQLTKSSRWRDPLYMGVAGVFAGAGIIFTPLAIYDAFRIPPHQPNIERLNLGGPQYDFDETLRFLGYRLTRPQLTEHGTEMVLCWEVLKLPERRAAFSVKLVRDGEILADRTSLFGMGNYDSTLWTVGHRFCDRVYVPVNDPDVPAEEEAPFRRDTVYDILLVVLDAETFAVDWQAIHLDGTPVEFPFVGQVETVP